MFLDECPLFRGIRLAVGGVVPILRTHPDPEHYALDAPAGVAAGESGGLIRHYHPPTHPKDFPPNFRYHFQIDLTGV